MEKQASNKLGSREELASRTGMGYADTYNMNMAEVETKLKGLKDVSDLLPVSATGKVRRPDGKFLSNAHLESIRANADLIRENAGQYTPVANPNVVTSPDLSHFTVPELAQTRQATNLGHDAVTAAHMRDNRYRPLDNPIEYNQNLVQTAEDYAATHQETGAVSLATPQGRIARFHASFRGIKGSLARKIANFGSGVSAANFQERMFAKAQTQRERGHELRARGLSTFAKLGLTTSAIIALRMAAPMENSLAHAADSIAHFDALYSGAAHHNPTAVHDLHELKDYANGNNHDYHFFDAHKEGPNDFGKSLNLHSEQASLKDLQTRYHQDPALLASHLVAFDPKYNNSDINRLANEFDKSPTKMSDAVKHLLELEKHYKFKVEDVRPGYKSLYMLEGPDGKPNVYQDNLVENHGTMLVAVDKETGRTVEIRRECGGQIIQEHVFTGVPNVHTIVTMTPPVEKPSQPVLEHPAPKVKRKPGHDFIVRTQPPAVEQHPTPTPTPTPTSTPTGTPPAGPPTGPPAGPPSGPPEGPPTPPLTHKGPDAGSYGSTHGVSDGLGNNGEIHGPGDLKPATPPPDQYTPPATPQPQTGDTATQAPGSTVNPSRPVISSPSGPTGGAGSGSIPSGNGAGTTNSGSSGGAAGV